MNSLAEQIIIDILKEEMAIPNDQIWISNQNKVLPNDKRLYVIVGLSDMSPVSITNTLVDDPAGMKEIQQIVMRENIQIDILSRSNESITRRYEILAALRSTYAQQKQESNSFKIFSLPASFANTSDAEGGSNINRFTTVMACHSWYRKEKITTGYDYYNDFKTRVDDENTIGTPKGIIDFEITPTTPTPPLN